MRVPAGPFFPGGKPAGLVCFRADGLKRVAAPLLALFILGFLQQTYLGVGNATAYDVFFCRGLARGLAQMCLGCAAYEVCKWFSALRFTRFARVLLTLLECVAWGSIFWYSQFGTQGLQVFMVIFALAMNIVIIFSRQSYLHRLFDFPWLALCGEFSLSIYLNHMVVRRILERITPFTNYYINSLLLLLFASLLAIAMMGFVRLWSRWWNNGLREICRKAFIAG